MRVKLEYLLIGIIVLFGLHLLIDRCCCNLNNGFRVGGPTNEEEYTELLSVYMNEWEDYLNRTDHINNPHFDDRYNQTYNEEYYKRKHQEEMNYLEGILDTNKKLRLLKKKLKSLENMKYGTVIDGSTLYDKAGKIITIVDRYGRSQYTPIETIIEQRIIDIDEPSEGQE